MMLAASQPEPKPKTIRAIFGSVRARLFAALLLAAAPGIVFGAIEARRNYEVASQREAAVRSVDGLRTAARLDDTLRASIEVARLLGTRREVRMAENGCSESLRTAMTAETRYVGAGLLNAQGKLICASEPGAVDASGATWFASLKAGGDSAMSSLQVTPYGSQRAFLAASPLWRGNTFQGAVFVAVPEQAIDDALAEATRVGPVALLAFDSQGALLGESVNNLEADRVEKAAAALTAGNGPIVVDGLIVERVASSSGAFSIAVVTPQGKQTEIGLQAALILLGPVLVAAFSFAVIWLALDWWVLRWFYRLQDMAEDFGAGRYAPAAMTGAPSEISDLASAFDAAVADARTRERDLATALAINTNLTRELHHRVKNNLQVLSSLVSRQQRRSEEPFVRNALSEARARMAPVALVYRFINPPEERNQIDVRAYLTELARQLHVALGGDARGVKLHIDVEHGYRSADDATNIGLVVAEALITGYANAAGMSAATATLTWRADANDACILTAGVRNGAATGRERALDKELIQEIARQLNTVVTFEPPATIILPLKIERDEVAPPAH